MGNADAAREAYEAFGRGDLQALKFTDDVVWVTSDELPLGGVTTGRDAVLQNFSQIPNHWSEFSLTPERFLESGDTVIVTGTQRSTGKGGSFEAPFVHLLEYRDGSASRGEFHYDTAKAKNALGDG